MVMSYDDAFYLACGTLAAKQFVLHLLQARARLGCDGAPATFSDDKTFPLKAVFDAVLLPKNKTIGLNTKQDVQRLEAVEKNNTENEPFFLLAAFAFGKCCASAASPQLLLAYVASRCVHSTVLITKKKTQPFRALSYLPGVAMGLYASVSVVLKTLK